MIKFALLFITCALAMTGISFLRKLTFPSLGNISINTGLTFLSQPNLWIGLFFSGITFLLYLYILNKYETSTVVPALLGINLFMVSAFSILFYGESLTLSKGLAYCLIFGGMWLLS